MTDQQPTPDNDADIATPVIESDGRPTASDHETPRRQGRWTGFTHRHPTGAVVGAGVVGLLVGAVAAAAVITITAPAPELPARAAAPWALGPIPRHLELGNRPPMPDQPAPPPPPAPPPRRQTMPPGAPPRRPGATPPPPPWGPPPPP
ncbi:hypothetical protein I553_9951 [Mycobacterium xenopi 4042]|uniref:Uncharacterized protein n=1 Tax=Mycobacterium xenopi 4042 TaxID=1299334 RepID=X7YP67_MYCXE|nr:hypothetical protein I553_9951 [Mycobacterium xenopi 4042]